jgi:tetratricopeptide (TPR) repeat protein
MAEPIQVFISYSRDSEAHEQRVAAFADRLRMDGIACTIDQDVDSPPEGWIQWMLARIREADFVLVVASGGYGTRHGTKWEDLIITQTIYRDASRNTKFVPIVFQMDDVQHIPLYLDATRFELWRPDHYKKLLRLLTNQPARIPAPIGKVPDLPAIEHLLHTPAFAVEERRPIPSAIPALLREFVDRETQRKSLRDLLAGNLSRLICVLGPGGFGKSMLVHHLLNELAPDSARIVDDRVAAIAYLRCEPGKTSLLDISQVLGKAIGETARLRDVFDSEQSAAEKVAFLLERVTATGIVWLVLDDFEKLLTTDDKVASPGLAAFLEAVVSTAHTLRVVATTRALPVLARHGMAIIEVDEGLPEDEAVAFLRREGARVGLDEEDESVLRDVVRRVHAIPKALESVLGFLADDPTTTIRDLLRDGRTFAAFEEHDAKVGVRALVQEQIAQQSDDALLVLAAIGVFAAPVPAEAVRHLLPGRDCTKPLARVVNNLLATRHRDLFDVHALVRELALKTLRARPEIGVTAEQLHERAADARLSNAKADKDAKSIEDLRPRLQAFHHLVEAGRFDRACEVLNEAQRTKLGNWGYYSQILEMRARLDGHLQEPRLQALDLFYRSMPLVRLGRVTEALDVLEKARAIATEIGDRMTVYRCANNTAVAFFNMLNIAAAIAWYERSLELVRELRNPATIPLGNLGEAYQYVGELDKAEQALLSAAELARERGNRRLEGTYLSDRAMIEHARGRSDEAIRLLTQSIQIAIEYGDRLREAFRWNALAEVADGSGSRDQAHAYASKALQIFEELGAVGRVTTQYAYVGILEWQLGREGHAEEAFRKGAVTHTEDGREYRAQLMLALLLIATNRSAEARPYLDAAMTTCERLLGWTPRFFRVRYHFAMGLLAKGETEAALRELDHALDVTMLPNLVLPQIRLLETLAGKAIPTDAAAQALERLRHALRH